jgi:hypothetical protein
VLRFVTAMITSGFVFNFTLLDPRLSQRHCWVKIEQIRIFRRKLFVLLVNF